MSEERPTTTWLERLIDAVFQPNVLLVLSCVVAVAVFLPRATRLLPDLNGGDQYRLSSSQIEITPPPDWVPQNLAEQVIRNAQLPDELMLLDSTIVSRVAEAFQRHPWIKGKVRIRTSIPARMIVDVEYREPVALVQTKGGSFPIDGDAVVLPSRDFSPADVKSYPVVEGISSLPQGAAGTAWQDPGVLGAARLAVYLKPFWKQFGFLSIKSGSSPSSKAAWDELSFQLSTVGGSRVIWGRPPESRHPGELPAEKKLERIKFYLRHHGPFDSSHGPHEFDITHWRDISRKPIAGNETTSRR